MIGIIYPIDLKDVGRFLVAFKRTKILIFHFSLTHVSTGDCYRFRAVDSESAVRWREAVREAMRPKSKDLMKFE